MHAETRSQFHVRHGDHSAAVGHGDPFCCWIEAKAKSVSLYTLELIWFCSTSTASQKKRIADVGTVSHRARPCSLVRTVDIRLARFHAYQSDQAVRHLGQGVRCGLRHSNRVETYTQQLSEESSYALLHAIVMMPNQLDLIQSELRVDETRTHSHSWRRVNLYIPSPCVVYQLVNPLHGTRPTPLVE